MNKIKLWIFIIVLIALPLATYLDYIYWGYKSLLGYFLTCLFEILIFFIGVALGENLNKEEQSSGELTTK